MYHNILILGPIHVGKTSVSKVLAKRTGKKLIEMDKKRKKLYKEAGYFEKESRKAYKAGGIMEWYQYQKPFELYAVKRILEESKNSVIDFGGGQSVYYDAGQIEEFLKAVEREPFIFLLLPSPDVEESVKLLGKRTSNNEKEINNIFIRSHSSRAAAKYIIYTKAKSVKEIAEEILSCVISYNMSYNL